MSYDGEILLIIPLLSTVLHVRDSYGEVDVTLLRLAKILELEFNLMDVLHRKCGVYEGE